MIESESTAKASLTRLPRNTLSPFKVIYATPDTVTLNENIVHNTVSIGRVTFVPYNLQGFVETDRDSEMKTSNRRMKEHRSEGNDARMIGEFQCRT